MNWLIRKFIIGYLNRLQKRIKGGDGMGAKNILKSKTLLANILAVILIIAQEVTGVSPAKIDPQTQTLILAIVNTVLRAFTKQPVKLGK